MYFQSHSKITGFLRTKLRTMAWEKKKKNYDLDETLFRQIYGKIKKNWAYVNYTSIKKL